MRRFRRVIGGVVALVLAVGQALVPVVASGGGSAWAASTALTPPPPPIPVNPAPYLREVTTPGPTWLPASTVISKDTVWSPQGSPYVVPSGGLAIDERGSLTLLPGTVVKVAPGEAAAIYAHGPLYALGTPGQRVVFTSLLDDSILGDTNGDGSLTAPQRGDWFRIGVISLAYLNYTDVRFGGGRTSAVGCFYGEVHATNHGRLVVSNSRFTESGSSGVVASSDERGYVGVFNSEFDNSLCGGGSNVQNGPHVVAGNTFGSGLSKYAWQLNSTHRFAFRHNTARRMVLIGGLSSGQIDTRFNSVLGGIENDVITNVPIAANWYGRNINTEMLPACMTRAEMDAYVPRLTAAGGTNTCPAGSFPPKLATAALPALSAPPPVIPEAVLDASAARFGPVSTSGGWLTYRAADVVVQDAGKTLTASRTYSSKRNLETDVGPGWSTSFSEALSTYQGGSSLTLGDGSSLPFAVDPAAGYLPAGGVGGDFTTGPTGSTVTSPGRTSYQFNPAGELTGLLLGDPGHRVDVARTDGKLAKVTGVSGRFLDYRRSGGRLTEVRDSQGRSVTMAYDNGRLASVTGVDGQRESYAYDENGRLTKVSAPSGRVVLAAGYQADGKVAWIEQAADGRTSFGYDSAARRTTMTRADGGQVVQEYDERGRLVVERVVGGAARYVLYDGWGRQIVAVEGVPAVAMEGYRPLAQAALIDEAGDVVQRVDPAGRGVSTTYNTAHRPVTTTFPDGGTIIRGYDAAGRLSSVTDQVGKVWAYTYNGRGQMLTERNPLNQTRSLTYETDGDLASVTDPAGAVTRYEFDDLGRPTVCVDALGHRWLTEYTSWGETRAVTAPSGAITRAEFDADRRVTAIVNGAAGRTGYEYDSGGRLSATVDALGQRATTAYDTTGRPVRVTDVRGSTVQLRYSSGGFVVSSTDPSNATTTAVNDPAGRPIRVTDPLGRITQTSYDPGGAIVRVDRPDGGVESTALDPAGRPTKYTSAGAATTTYAYDLAGRVLARTDPLGKIARWGYDALGRTTSVTDELGRVTQRTYDDARRMVTATDALGTLEVTVYDALGNEIAVTDGSGRTRRNEYTVDGLPAAMVDSGGGRTGYEYDATGRLVAIVDPLGRRASTVPDALGRSLSITDPAGHSTAFTYDAGGLITSTTDRTGGTRRYAYDARGLLTTATDPLGKVTTFQYDAVGRRTLVTDPTGVERHTAYDPVGRPAVIWDTTGASWVSTYDLDSNVLLERDPTGLSMSYTYNKRGERTVLRWGESSSVGSSPWNYTYDAAGNLTTVRRPGGGNESYAYDERNRLTQETDADGKPTRFGYDGADRRTSTTTASGKTTTWTYDNAGRIATAADPLGNTARYGYDAAGELITLTLPRGGVYRYTFDAIGRVATEADPTGNITRSQYDDEGRLTRTETPAGRVVIGRYDAAGRLRQREAGGVIRGFGYDDAGRVTSTTVGGQPDTAFSHDNRGLVATSTDRFGTSRYTYDDAGRVTTMTPPAGTATTYAYKLGGVTAPVGAGLLASVRGPVNVDYTYNADRLVSQRKFVSPGAARTDSYTYSAAGRVTGRTEAAPSATTYTYAADGQVATATEPVAGTDPKVTNYGYDSAGRLASWRISQGQATLAQATYAWDADGNRTQATGAPADAVTYSYDLAGRLQSSSDGLTYTYDNDGNQTSAGGATRTVTYGYNAFGELSNVAQEPGSTVAFARDALGRTTAQTVDGSTQYHAYRASSYTLARTGKPTEPTTEIIPGANGETLAQATVGARTLRSGTNLHGDMTSWQDNATGTAVVRTDFDPFGTVTNATGAPAPANLGYQGDLTEAASGLVDMGFRAYDPPTGRFPSADNIPGALGAPASLNRYTYGFGDPANHIDPDGHWPEWLDRIGRGIRDYVNWWGSSWTAGWNGTEPTATEPTWVHDVNSAVDNNHDTIAEFAVSTVVFVGCEAAVGAPTAGVGAVAGAAGCGALAGTLGGLAGQAIRCRENKTPDACDPAEFARATLVSGLGGAVGSAIGGPIGTRVATTLARTGLNSLGGTALGRTLSGALTGTVAGGASGAAAGFVAGAADYGLGCHAACTWSGMLDAAIRSATDAGLSSGLLGGLGGGAGARRARPAVDTEIARRRKWEANYIESTGMLPHPDLSMRRYVPWIRGDIHSPELTVYRVEGSANQRLDIDSAGNVSIIGDSVLYLNFGDEVRAQFYRDMKIRRGLTDAQIKSFRMPREFVDGLWATSVPEEMGKVFPTNALQVDRTKAHLNSQFGIRSNDFPILLRNIIPGSGRPLPGPM